MAEPPRVLIAGGYGVFGSLLARELLAATSLRILIAGRNRSAAALVCQRLGAPGRCEALALDLNDRESLRKAASGCFAVVCAAGPFQRFDHRLPLIAVETGAHWLDISDDEGWILPILDSESLDAAARVAGRTILPGLSTTPALSGALVRWCRNRAPQANRARVVLWIGNHNRKGAAAIASALRSGFRDPVSVHLPTGPCRAYRFRSPDEALLRREVAMEAEFRVAFEWELTSWLIARLQSTGSSEKLSSWLARLSMPFSRFGSDGGCLQTDVFDREGRALVTAAFSAKGQRLAVLPAVLALQALLSGELRKHGSVSPASWLAPEEWVARLAARGLQFGSGGREVRAES
ncbi:MAG: hypothetical protein ACRD1P_11980 [Thermoanaerobaculia bacterium]